MPVVVATLALIGCGSDEPVRSTGDDVRTNLSVVRGLPQDGITLGRTSAPATLSVYTPPDSYMNGFFRSDLPTIVRRWVRDGQVRIQVRFVPLGNELDHRRATATERLATSAGVDDRLWDFLAALSARYDGTLDRRVLSAALADVPGLDADKVRARARSPEVVRAVARSVSRAGLVGIMQTPAFLFDARRADDERLDASCRGCLVRSLGRALAAERADAPSG